MSDGRKVLPLDERGAVDMDALQESGPGAVAFGVVDWSGESRVVEWHNCNGVVVGGPLTKGVPGRSWEIVSVDPLTVVPSIWCRPPEGCGLHGWIREGHWVDA